MAPALAIVPLTHRVMLEKNIDLGDCYPKEMEHVDGVIDLIINMSGHDLPVRPGAEVEVWEVRDPIGESDEVFRHVRDQIGAAGAATDRKDALAQACVVGEAKASGRAC